MNVFNRLHVDFVKENVSGTGQYAKWELPYLRLLTVMTEIIAQGQTRSNDLETTI